MRRIMAAIAVAGFLGVVGLTASRRAAPTSRIRRSPFASSYRNRQAARST